MRLLLVEDEDKTARLLSQGLAEEGHAVDLCRNGQEGFEQALAIPYDVILLDWALPDRDGVAVLRDWRARGLSTPVLMLTARGTVGERVLGLRAGADDYLPKPFAFDELLARIEALHRRVGGHVARRNLGAVLLDSERRRLVHGDREVALTPREYALLSELAGHLGEALTRTHLLRTVWGDDFDVATNAVDVYVGYLRAKLRALEAEDAARIESVRGVGYRLVVEEARA